VKRLTVRKSKSMSMMYASKRISKNFFSMSQTITRSRTAMKSSIFRDISPCSSQNQQTFRRNMLPSSSGYKNKQTKEPA
jgi:hypothetical protein